MTRTSAKCPLWFGSVMALLAASCRSQPALTEEAWDKAHKMVIPYFRTRPLFPPNWPDTTREFPVEQPGESDWPMNFNKKLQEPISFDFDATPLDDVVAFLRTMKKVCVVLDRGTLKDRVNTQVTLRVDNVPFHEALRQILEPLGLEYTALPHGLFISTREMILKLPNLSNDPTVYYDPVEWKPLEPIMRKRISFEFRGELPREVFESLQKQIGVPIIAGEPGKMRGVNLKVQDMQVRYALAWVCEDLTMAYSVRDGKIIVSGR